MAQRCKESVELFERLTKLGFTPEFSDLVSGELYSPWVAQRMLGYLRNVRNISEEEVVDEMLAIISDRDRIRQKKEMEFYQGKINQMYNSTPFGEDE